MSSFASFLSQIDPSTTTVMKMYLALFFFSFSLWSLGTDRFLDRTHDRTHGRDKQQEINNNDRGTSWSGRYWHSQIRSNVPISLPTVLRLLRCFVSSLITQNMGVGGTNVACCQLFCCPNVSQFLTNIPHFFVSLKISLFGMFFKFPNYSFFENFGIFSISSVWQVSKFVNFQKFSIIQFFFFKSFSIQKIWNVQFFTILSLKKFSKFSKNLFIFRFFRKHYWF